MDYFPTFLELAEVSDYQKTLDGDSLVPLMKGGELKKRALFWHIASTFNNPPCSAMLEKLVAWRKSNQVPLPSSLKLKF